MFQLASVNISWCEMMTAAGVAALADGCQSLKTFIAKGCLHIGDEALYQLVRRCWGLQIVNLHGCRNVQDDGIIELSEASPNLRYRVVVLQRAEIDMRGSLYC